MDALLGIIAIILIIVGCWMIHPGLAVIVVGAWLISVAANMD